MNRLIAITEAVLAVLSLGALIVCAVAVILLAYMAIDFLF